ncbi:MAG: 1-(5-phosphoribosyl)-5-[(5-phosphoribosylamino)methylideneamino]imidazole-4-carboxamide isomerase [Enterobacterales bacterium]
MIIPALDLIDGKVVRLYQGNYKLKNIYDVDPLVQLTRYISYGAKLIHLIDLNGAKNPSLKQTKLLLNLINNAKFTSVQVGGGIRNTEDIEILLNAGAQRIIIGSSVILNFNLIKSWFKIFGPDRFILALDILQNSKNINYILIEGWQQNTNITLNEIMCKIIPLGIKNILCTDISRDGTLTGSNIKLYSSLCNKWPNINFQASGGISSLEDISNLCNIGIKDIIIGKALLDNKFTLLEAINCYRKE